MSSPSISSKISTQSQQGWEVEVEVADHKYKVFVNQLTLDNLNGETPEKLAEASFRFLLDREPPESILKAFNLEMISQYFPEYEAKIADYMPK